MNSWNMEVHVFAYAHELAKSQQSTVEKHSRQPEIQNNGTTSNWQPNAEWH